jgi:hypothetical protein
MKKRGPLPSDYGSKRKERRPALTPVEIWGGEKFRFRLVGREGRANQILYDFEKRWMHVKKKTWMTQ